MPIKTEMWRIDGGLQKVTYSSIEAEKKLESILEKDITIVDTSLMVIGRQVPTAYGKLIDLLAIDSEGHLAVIEIKRDRTPREIIAQIIDYASWVQSLTYENITEIYSQNNPEQHFEQAFEERFGTNPPESLNEEHRLIVVASELDNSTERIINYLTENYSVPINVVFFRYFKEDEKEYLTRTWLIDPVEAEMQADKRSKSRTKEIWNGRDYYVSFGEGSHRSWKDARKYGFIAAGGGKWYSGTLSLLNPGARVFVCIPKVGYVGVGVVREPAIPVKEFMVETGDEKKPILDISSEATDMGKYADDPELSEYLVRIDWIKTLPAEKAIWEKGMFANQNSACKLRNKFTIERLTARFELDD